MEKLCNQKMQKIKKGGNWRKKVGNKKEQVGNQKKQEIRKLRNSE